MSIVHKRKTEGSQVVPAGQAFLYIIQSDSLHPVNVGGYPGATGTVTVKASISSVADIVSDLPVDAVADDLGGYLCPTGFTPSASKFSVGSIDGVDVDTEDSLPNNVTAVLCEAVTADATLGVKK